MVFLSGFLGRNIKSVAIIELIIVKEEKKV